MNLNRSKTQGFTLIEVLIATGMVTLVMTGITSGVSFAVKNSRFSQQKSLSVRYAQESIEWFRAQRDTLGWQAFYQTLENDSPSQVIYCLADLPQNSEQFGNLSSTPGGAYCSTISSTNYRRQIELTITSPSSVDVISRVTWEEGPNQNETILTTTLREWR